MCGLLPGLRLAALCVEPGPCRAEDVGPAMRRRILVELQCDHSAGSEAGCGV